MRDLSNEELISRLEAINRSNAIIDFDLDGNILRVNEIFLKAVGYKTTDSAKIVGRHHSIFVSPDYADSEEYKNFWATLKSGKFFSGEFERIKKEIAEKGIESTFVDNSDNEELKRIQEEAIRKYGNS